LGLSAYDARVLTDDQLVVILKQFLLGNPKQAANWIMGDIAAYLNTPKLSITSISFYNFG